MKLYPNITIFTAIWATVVLIVFYLGFSTLPHSNIFPGGFLKSLANWDGGHYLSIAQYGYQHPSQYVFFPLYPMLINLVSQVTGNYVVAAIFISFTCFFLAINLLYRLISLDFGKQFAQRGILALLFFPLSFHFLTVYTESLFLFLTVAAFLSAKKRNFLLATIFAAAASATRLSGLGVALSLVGLVFLTEKFNAKNWVVLLSPLGFLIYVLFLYHQTGDMLYFIHAESYFWKSGLVFPGSALVFTLKQLLTPDFLVNNFRVLLDFAFTMFGIVAVFKVWRRLGLDYALFAIFSMTLPLFSPTIVAIPRYLITIFPIFIMLGFVRNQYSILFYQIFGLMVATVYAILFINGYWVS